MMKEEETKEETKMYILDQLIPHLFNIQHMHLTSELSLTSFQLWILRELLLLLDSEKKRWVLRSSECGTKAWTVHSAHCFGHGGEWYHTHCWQVLVTTSWHWNSTTTIIYLSMISPPSSALRTCLQSPGHANLHATISLLKIVQMSTLALWTITDQIPVSADNRREVRQWTLVAIAQDEKRGRRRRWRAIAYWVVQ